MFDSIPVAVHLYDERNNARSVPKQQRCRLDQYATAERNDKSKFNKIIPGRGREEKAIPASVSLILLAALREGCLLEMKHGGRKKGLVHIEEGRPPSVLL